MITVRAPFTRLVDTEVFAVTDTTAQLLVRTSGPVVRVRHGADDIEHDTVHGVALVPLEGLEPSTRHRVELDASGDTRFVDVETRGSIGAVSARIATISDVHLGLEKFGVGRKLRDDMGGPYALRCAQAAIDEARAWGADLLVIKGDLTESGSASDWKLAGELLDGIDIPVLFTAGNHDVWGTRHLQPGRAAESIDLAYDPVQVVDLPGVRVVLADTSRPGRGTGDLARMSDELDAAVSCDEPVLLAFHHHVQRAPLGWFWPPGISSINALPTLRALQRRNPNLFVTSGHTHRNRRHDLGRTSQLTYTEVSATSDYPGVWAGYEVSDSTIRQTVFRIAAPAALAWTERTRQVLRGVWPAWSQGRLDDRCVDLELR